MEPWGERTLSGGQPSISRTHRESVRLPYDGTADNPRWNEKRLTHSAHQQELLKILLAEIRRVRSGNLKQLQYDREHAGKVAGAMGAAEFTAQFTFDHRISGAIRIHLVDSRREY